MKHLYIEETTCVWQEFEVDDSYTTPQLKKMLKVDEDSWSDFEDSEELIDALKKQGVKIKNENAGAQPTTVLVHLEDEHGDQYF